MSDKKTPEEKRPDNPTKAAPAVAPVTKTTKTGVTVVDEDFNAGTDDSPATAAVAKPKAVKAKAKSPPISLLQQFLSSPASSYPSPFDTEFPSSCDRGQWIILQTRPRGIIKFVLEAGTEIPKNQAETRKPTDLPDLSPPPPKSYAIYGHFEEKSVEGTSLEDYRHEEYEFLINPIEFTKNPYEAAEIKENDQKSLEFMLNTMKISERSLFIEFPLEGEAEAGEGGKGEKMKFYYFHYLRCEKEWNYQEINEEEKFLLGENYRQKGKSYWEMKKPRTALRMYQKGFLAMDSIEIQALPQIVEEKIYISRIHSLSNCSVCHLSLKQYELSIEKSSRAIEIIQNHSPSGLEKSHIWKILYRRGEAYRLSGEFLQAMRDFQRILDECDDEEEKLFQLAKKALELTKRQEKQANQRGKASFQQGFLVEKKESITTRVICGISWLFCCRREKKEKKD